MPGRKAPAPGAQSAVPFQWIPSLYRPVRNLAKGVDLISHKSTGVLVVKKVVKLEEAGRFVTPREVFFLSELRRCNRIVEMLAHQMDDPEPKKSTVFYPYFEHGDVRIWRKANFGSQNLPVPEECIWRFFIQMSQALAFIHKGSITGTLRNWKSIIHRDIKPDNILVTYRGGSLYPSFLLTDFGVAKQMLSKEEQLESNAGTYVWQPPELPRINTPQADIWSMGAVIHYMAVNDAPVEDITAFENRERQRYGKNLPKSLRDTNDPSNYWRSHVPRQVTDINYLPVNWTPACRRPYHAYSDTLAHWMKWTLRTGVTKRTTTTRLLREMVPQARQWIADNVGRTALHDLDFVVGDYPAQVVPAQVTTTGSGSSAGIKRARDGVDTLKARKRVK